MKFIISFFVPAGILIVWAILSTLLLVDPLFLPSPWMVAKSICVGLLFEGLWSDLIVTIARSLVGFLLAAIIGIPMGLVIGRNPRIAQATQPTIDFFRSVPATALFPLFLFIFGIGDLAKIAVVIYACSLIVLVNTAYGAMQVKAPRILSATVMGASNWAIFWKIIVPESTPGIFSGLRVALSLSFALVVVTEMFIGTTVGIGYQIINAQMIYHIPEMYAAIFLIGIVGFFFNLLLIAIGNRVLHWADK